MHPRALGSFSTVVSKPAWECELLGEFFIKDIVSSLWHWKSILKTKTACNFSYCDENLRSPEGAVSLAPGRSWILVSPQVWPGGGTGSSWLPTAQALCAGSGLTTPYSPLWWLLSDRRHSHKEEAWSSPSGPVSTLGTRRSLRGTPAASVTLLPAVTPRAAHARP